MCLLWSVWWVAWKPACTWLSVTLSLCLFPCRVLDSSFFSWQLHPIYLTKPQWWDLLAAFWSFVIDSATRSILGCVQLEKKSEFLKKALLKDYSHLIHCPTYWNMASHFLVFSVSFRVNSLVLVVGLIPGGERQSGKVISMALRLQGAPFLPTEPWSPRAPGQNSLEGSITPLLPEPSKTDCQKFQVSWVPVL